MYKVGIIGLGQIAYYGATALHTSSSHLIDLTAPVKSKTFLK